MLPATSTADPVWAIIVAVIYFGSVIAFGAIARMVCAWLMRRYGADLGDVQKLAGENRGERDAFLLGFWRKER